ncbi:TagK domain-containing protein [Sapientia aquatica]|nr:TagK domain-containing protein [Sapientia aquatica]
MKYDLNLKVKYQYGESTDEAHIVSFSEDGFLGIARFGHILPSLDFAWLEEAQCSVKWRSLGNVSAWWLQHQSQRWICTVNDQVLPCGDKVMLHHGDRIEIGLLCLEVIDPLIMGQRLTNAQPYTHHIAREIDLLIDHQFDRFPPLPLDLANPIAPTMDSNEYSHDNPFDIINSIWSESYFQIETSTPQDGSLASAGVEQHLSELRKEYFLAVLDPTSLYSQQSTQHHVIGSSSIDFSSQVISASLNHDEPLEDLLAGRLSIDAILEQLGLAENIEKPDQPNEVLRLFYPTAHSADHQKIPPELTRREHHVISPDSAYSSTSATQTTDEPDTMIKNSLLIKRG